MFEVPAQDKERGESFAAWVERVGNPMADGHDVVFQMPFVHDGIRGIADFLVRTVDPDTGAVTYEPVDAKLARNEAKPGHVLQLCFYAEALTALTGAKPTHVRIALGSGQVETIRVDDVLPYWRRLRGQLAKLIDAPPVVDTFPEPCDHCQFCQFEMVCEDAVARRRLARPRRRCPPGRPAHAAGGPRQHDRPPGRARSGDPWSGRESPRPFRPPGQAAGRRSRAAPSTRRRRSSW